VIVPERAFGLGEHVGSLCQQVAQQLTPA
jgi:hypothetical protein